MNRTTAKSVLYGIHLVAPSGLEGVAKATLVVQLRCLLLGLKTRSFSLLQEGVWWPNWIKGLGIRVCSSESLILKGSRDRFQTCKVSALADDSSKSMLAGGSLSIGKQLHPPPEQPLCCLVALKHEESFAYTPVFSPATVFDYMVAFP